MLIIILPLLFIFLFYKLFYKKGYKKIFKFIKDNSKAITLFILLIFVFILFLNSSYIWNKKAYEFLDIRMRENLKQQINIEKME